MLFAAKSCQAIKLTILRHANITSDCTLPRQHVLNKYAEG